jgi:hypothetical protein
MGISEQPRRPTPALLWLASLVVVVSGGSWFVTSTIGHNAASLTHGTRMPKVTSGSTPPACQPDQIQLVGAFNDCASVDLSRPLPCSVSQYGLDAAFYLSGTSGTMYLVEIGIPNYVRAGDYGLTGSAVYVVVRAVASTAFWQSSTGLLGVTADNGQAGSIYASLNGHDVSKGGAQQTLLPLQVEGPWRCG